MNIDHLEALLSGKRLEPLIVGHVYDPKLMCVVRAANTDAILLSPDTIVKQRRLHPDIGLDEYYLLPDVIRYGWLLRSTQNNSFFVTTIIQTAGSCWLSRLRYRGCYSRLPSAEQRLAKQNRFLRVRCCCETM